MERDAHALILYPAAHPLLVRIITMLKRTAGILVEAAKEWMKDKAPRLSAAVAYYTLFSIAPLLVIAIAIAGMVFDEEAARGEIVDAVRGLIGDIGARGVEQMVLNASRAEGGVLATILGIGVLIFGASGVFGQLKDALNTIWDVKEPKKTGIARVIRTRIFSFAMVLAVGFLLLVTLVISAALAALGRFFSSRLPGGEGVWHALNFGLSVAVITVVFAALFKFLPDKQIAWRDVWAGALFTSILFSIGKILIGIYLGKSALSTTYGAAASLAIILVWIYYSALIFFYGAEFTEVFARTRASGGKRGEEKCLASPRKLDEYRARRMR